MARKISEAFIAGLFLIIIGAFFILGNFGILVLPMSYKWLVTIIMLSIGVFAAIKTKYMSKLTGLVALVLGGIFLLNLLGIVSWDACWKFKEAVFLFLGLFLIF